MPGLLLHLTFGKMIYDKIGSKMNIDKSDFLSGCLIPDMTTDKKASHYRVPATITKYLVPDMDKVIEDLLDIKSSLKLGILCHLFLDYHFFENYIFKNYKWEKGYVTVPHNGYKLSNEEFFAREGIYSAYGELNHLLLRDKKINYDDLEIIPELLPNTNIEIFDNRRDKSWRMELYEYFITENEYSGRILDYTSVISLLENLAFVFINTICEP